MQVIPREELQVPEKPFNYGSFSSVYKIEYNSKTYCFKQITWAYSKDIWDNISSMTDEIFSPEFLTPLYMVQSKDTHCFDGYLTEFDERLKDIQDIYDRDRKILMLKKARLAILKLHEENNRIHGDLSSSNMLFNNDLEKAFLIDFDSSLKINQQVKNNISFSRPVKEYLKYHPLDFNVDAYSFNLNTLAILGKIDPEIMLLKIADDNFFIPEDNPMIRKLSRELLLGNTRNAYSGEYIIDYV